MQSIDRQRAKVQASALRAERRLRFATIRATNSRESLLPDVEQAIEVFVALRSAGPAA
jgi:hypothetical protein